MVDDLKQCETCPWPLDCCTEDGAPVMKAADCPRDHDVWKRHIADSRLTLVETPAVAIAEPEEDLIEV